MSEQGLLLVQHLETGVFADKLGHDVLHHGHGGHLVEGAAGFDQFLDAFLHLVEIIFAYVGNHDFLVVSRTGQFFVVE